MASGEIDRFVELKGQMTDEEFGRKIGYAGKTVNSIIHGHRKLSDRVFNGIALAYGTEVAEYVRTGKKAKLPAATSSKAGRDREEAMRMLDGLGTEELKKVLEYARLLKADKKRSADSGK